MFHRHPLTIRSSTLLLALLMLLGASSASLAANTSVFRYQTNQWTTVDITLAATDASPVLLSFYSEGTNGLRLLENAFTDSQGHFAAEMSLPAHLNQVVVVVRGSERQDTLTLPITDESIAYAE